MAVGIIAQTGRKTLLAAAGLCLETASEGLLFQAAGLTSNKGIERYITPVELEHST
jgi:hypothetical protein